MTASARVRRAGVIAAGEGARLRQATQTLKPLVAVGGMTLVERVLTSIAEVAPVSVTVIVNESSLAVREHAASRAWPFTLDWIVETTPTSMHSFLRVVEALAGVGPVGPSGETGYADEGPFLVSTVDTVAAPGAFKVFADRSLAIDADVIFAIVEVPAGDDKPLLVELASDGARVASIGAGAAGSPWATAGYYSVRSSVLREAEAARRDGLTALRQFFGRLQDRGFRLAAVPVTGSVDVDRPADVAAAEQFLKQAGA